MDSTTRPNVKIMKGKVIGVPSLVHYILRVEGHTKALGWGLGRLTSKSIIHTDLQKPNKLVSVQLKHFWCTDESQNSQWPGLGGSHHCPPLIVFFVPGHGANTQMSFCPGIPKCLEILKIGTPATLEAHNFMCKPLIEVRYQTKLQPSSRTF